MPWVPALVHVFTSLGAVCGLMAAKSVAAADAEGVFFWLIVALFIDGIDGTFARAVKVTERLPRFSGERLDLVVDYVTYVFVPVLALLAWKHLDGLLGIVLASGILLSSLFHFSDLESKNDDNCFVGFPAVWNVVAFYVFAFQPPSWLTAVAVALAIAGTFVPMPWVHPLRVVAMRGVTIIVTLAASVAAVITAWQGFPARGLAQGVLVLAAIYFVAQTALWWRSGAKA